MSDRLQVIITGSNGVSRVFQEITRDATAMGTGIERSGQTASRAMATTGESATVMGQEVESSAARTEASFARVGSSIGKIGMAFGAFSLIAGQAGGQLEAANVRMETSFKDAGLAIEDYQAKIDAAQKHGEDLAFNEKSIDDSLAALVGVTKDGSKAFTDLALAQDIARGKGESLADATQTVVSVEAGRFRGLAQLGIALDATSTKEDYLAALQAKFAGQSEAFANTSAAAYQRYRNEAEHALESVGSHLQGLAIPLLAMSTAAEALGPLTEHLKEMAGEGALLDVALGPVGLAAGALAAGAGILYLITRTHEFTSAATAATGEAQSLNNYFLSLADTLDPVRAQAIKAFNDNLNQFTADAAKRQDDLGHIKTLASIVGEGDFAKSFDLNNQEVLKTTESLTGLTEAELRYIDATYGNKDSIITWNEVAKAVSNYQQNLDRLNADQIKTQQSDITKIFSQSTVDYQKAIDGIEKWQGQLKAGIITGTQFIDLLNNAAEDQSVFGRTVGTTTEVLTANTAAVSASGKAIADQMAAYDAQNKSLNQAIDFTKTNTAVTIADTAAHEANGRAVAAQMAEYDRQNSSLDHTIQQTKALATIASDARYAQSMAIVRDVLIGTTAATNAGIPATKEFTAVLDAQVTAAVDAQKALATYQGQLGQGAALYGDHAANFARGQNVANDALGSGYQAIVGNTNAISDQIEGIRKWAVELINVGGQYGNIDDLLRAGAISQKEYNDAQAAGNVIFRAASEIEDDMAAIQAKQAPIIAELSANEEAYLNHLADLPPQMQLVRLGYMDTAESAKALAAQQLAASAASGALGKAGEESASKIIQGAAEADPVLQALLVDMHLISVNKDTGEITVDFGSVSDANSATGDLIKAMNRLSRDIEKLYKLSIDSSEAVVASGDVDAVTRAVGDLDGKHADVRIGADTSDYYTAVSGLGLGTIIGDAFVHVRAIVDPAVSNPSSGEPPVGGSGGQSAIGVGGVVGIAGYAGGGMVRATLAEYGPEMIRLAGGGNVMAWERGTYSVPRGAYVETAAATRSLAPMGAPNVTININGVGKSTEQIVRELVPALVQATQSHYQAHGLR